MSAVGCSVEKVASPCMLLCACLLLDGSSSPCYPPAVVPSVVSAHVACLPPVLREDVSALPVVEGTFLIEVQPVSVRLERNVSPVSLDKAHWNYVTLYLKYGQCHVLHTWITLVMGEGWRKKALKKLHLKTMHTSAGYATAQRWIRDLQGSWHIAQGHCGALLRYRESVSDLLGAIQGCIQNINGTTRPRYG